MDAIYSVSICKISHFSISISISQTAKWLNRGSNQSESTFNLQIKAFKSPNKMATVSTTDTIKMEKSMKIDKVSVDENNESLSDRPEIQKPTMDHVSNQFDSIKMDHKVVSSKQSQPQTPKTNKHQENEKENSIGFTVYVLSLSLSLCHSIGTKESFHTIFSMKFWIKHSGQWLTMNWWIHQNLI